MRRVGLSLPQVTLAEPCPVPQSLLDLFPTATQAHRRSNDDEEGSNDQSTSKKLRLVLESAQLQHPIVDADVQDQAPGGLRKDTTIRPGNFYRRYRREEELNENLKLFLEEASELIGVSLGTLTSAVFECELKLEKWQKQQSRNRSETASPGRSPVSVETPDVDETLVDGLRSTGGTFDKDDDL